MEDESGCVARVDPSQLENAVLNLCINSRDAMPNGGLLTLEVDTMNVDPSETHLLADLDSGDYVTLAVTDTGEGMSPEVISQAFEPFFTTKEMGKGTGLGLSMVYGFVDIEGGSEHILVVEDNAAVQEQVIRHLQQLGYQTTPAKNGPGALALLQKGSRFDLLFTDVVMPGGMNGLQLAHEAQSLHNRACRCCSRQDVRRRLSCATEPYPWAPVC